MIDDEAHLKHFGDCGEYEDRIGKGEIECVFANPIRYSLFRVQTVVVHPACSPNV